MRYYLEKENSDGGIFLNEYFIDQSELAKDSIGVELIIVYRTENEEKFLDEDTLAKLLGLTKMNDYVGSDGSTYSASDSIVVNKGVDNGYKRTGTHYSGLDSYPYDYILGLYRVTDFQLADLMKRYEERNNVKLDVEYRDIDYKHLNDTEKYSSNASDEIKSMFEVNIKNDELADMLKDNSVIYDDDFKINKK